MIRKSLRSLRDVVQDVIAPSPLDRTKASDLAAKLRDKPVALVSEYVKNKEGQTIRKIAWRGAGPQIEGAAKLFAAMLQYLIAEGYEITTDEDETLAMARAAALWAHGVTEDDVEEG